MSKKDKAEKKQRKGGFGKFLLGTFIGFLLCIGLIAGVGCFAYFKLSLNWVNKTFKTDISTGVEEVDNLTIKQALDKVIYLGQNLDNYTLNDLNKDFGVDFTNTVMGIDISSLKDVPILEITEKAQDLLADISAYELRDIVSLNGIDSLLNKKNIYYFNEDDKFLYLDKQDDEYLNKVTEDDFVYSYNETEEKIEIKGQLFTISDGKVEIEIKYLPLTKALADYKDFTVAEVLGFKISGDAYYEDKNSNNVLDSGEEVSGIMNAIADKKIGKLEAEINSLTVAEILDLKKSGNVYYTDKDNDGILDEGEEVETILNIIAETTISGLTEKINGLTIGDLLGNNNTGIAKLIDKTQPVEKITEEIEDVLTESSLNTLVSEGIITLTDTSKLGNDITYKGEDTTIGALTLSEFVDYALSLM